MSILTIAVGLILSGAGVSGPPTCVGEGSAAALPSGWVYIDSEGIDIVSGAYHHSPSDLFVSMDLDYGAAFIKEPWAVGRARERAAISRSERTGRYYVTRTSVPAKNGCKEHFVSIQCDAHPASWNVAAVVCTSEQRANFDALSQLLTDSDWPRFPSSVVDPPIRTAKTLIGRAWHEVRERLGVPISVKPGPSDSGFVVMYSGDGDAMDLTFDKKQVLVAVNPRR